jgi:hypothetical protein
MKRKLNLVYDDWAVGEEKPKPNGVKIYNGDLFWDGEMLIRNYYDRGLAFGYYEDQFPEESDRFETVKCRMEDVKQNPNQKYYYVMDYFRFDLCKALCCGEIEHGEVIDAVLNRIPPMNEEVLKSLREDDNFFLIMMTAHEPEGVKAFECVNEFLEKHSINPKKIFIVNNNSKLNELKHTYSPNVNVHSLKFIPNTSNYSLTRINSRFNPNKEGKFFLCHNRSPKVHRYTILTLLKHEGLLDDVNWSLVPSYSAADRAFFGTLLNREDYKKYDEEIEYFRSVDIKRSDYEVDEKWFKPNTPEINVDGLPTWMRVPEKELTFENSYINIVTESSYINSDFIVHITEKSFRPFYHYQLPIFVASHHHIRHLKETYGFDMFDDIIDHSYDNVINHRDRLFKIVDEIKRLNGKKEEIKEFYKNNYERFEKNKIIIYNILKNTDDYLFFRNLI